MTGHGFGSGQIPEFRRAPRDAGPSMTRIGDGEIGGKAHGLAFARELLAAELPAGEVDGLRVEVPSLTVITTEVFDAFIERNGLREIALSEAPDERIAHAFQQAELPAEFVGDLMALIDRARSPLAVRSSSLLEDALFRPFAGVYATKMIPNNEADAARRFQRLAAAIKLVFASTYFGSARRYVRSTEETIGDEKMAVIVQEVVGTRRGERFYPDVSAVARSHNYYAFGAARPADGVVDLALGLGKTIVDGGISWSYSPKRPKAPPPFGSVADMIRNTQLRFWAVNLGRPPEYDPIVETEYLIEADLAAADYDGVLDRVASTLLRDTGRLVPGTSRPGTRVVDFAPLLTLELVPLNRTVRRLLTACEAALGEPVEIELALCFPGPGESAAPRLGLLQVRPMVVSGETVEIPEQELDRPGLLLASDRVLGNGAVDSIRDIVYIRPERFEARRTRQIAAELDAVNTKLFAAGTPYLLIGFGRWGSSDPWLGVPVEWGNICGAGAVVEATLPQMDVDPSQGSHFFHNISSFQVSYFFVRHGASRGIDWEWLARQPAQTETESIRHVRLDRPLRIRVDGRSSTGAIWRS